MENVCGQRSTAPGCQRNLASLEAVGAGDWACAELASWPETVLHGIHAWRKDVMISRCPSLGPRWHMPQHARTLQIGWLAELCRSLLVDTIITLSSWQLHTSDHHRLKPTPGLQRTRCAG